MNAPVKLDTLPEWRLDDLYSGREDPRIETDLAAAKAANDKLAAMEGRFVAARADAAGLGLAEGELAGFDVGGVDVAGVEAMGAELGVSEAAIVPAQAAVAPLCPTKTVSTRTATESTMATTPTTLAAIERVWAASARRCSQNHTAETTKVTRATGTRMLANC